MPIPPNRVKTIDQVSKITCNLARNQCTISHGYGGFFEGTNTVRYGEGDVNGVRVVARRCEFGFEKDVPGERHQFVECLFDYGVCILNHGTWDCQEAEGLPPA